MIKPCTLVGGVYPYTVVCPFQLLQLIKRSQMANLFQEELFSLSRNHCHSLKARSLVLDSRDYAKRKSLRYYLSWRWCNRTRSEQGRRLGGFLYLQLHIVDIPNRELEISKTSDEGDTIA